MADPQLVGIVCERGQVAQARAEHGSRNLVAETPLKIREEDGKDHDVVVLYYHTNPAESRLPSEKEELRLLKTKAEPIEFTPSEHPVHTERKEMEAEKLERTEEDAEPPEPTVPSANPPGVQGSGAGTETGPAASAEAIAAVVEPPPPSEVPTTPALGGVSESGQQAG